MVVIVPIHYNHKTQEGCFKTMLEQQQTTDAIIVFNDNVLDHLDWDDSTPGAGSAKIRPYAWQYNQNETPRVVGLPTGFSSASKGFKTLDRDAKEAIDATIQRLVVFCRKHPSIRRIIYAADKNNDKMLGTGIFEVDEQVLKYISTMLWKIPTLVDDVDLNMKSLEKIRAKELLLLPRAKLEKEYALLKQINIAQRTQPRTIYTGQKRLHSWIG